MLKFILFIRTNGGRLLNAQSNESTWLNGNRYYQRRSMPVSADASLKLSLSLLKKMQLLHDHLHWRIRADVLRISASCKWAWSVQPSFNYQLPIDAHYFSRLCKQLLLSPLIIYTVQHVLTFANVFLRDRRCEILSNHGRQIIDIPAGLYGSIKCQDILVQFVGIIIELCQDKMHRVQQFNICLVMQLMRLSVLAIQIALNSEQRKSNAALYGDTWMLQWNQIESVASFQTIRFRLKSQTAS